MLVWWSTQTCTDRFEDNIFIWNCNARKPIFQLLASLIFFFYWLGCCCIHNCWERKGELCSRSSISIYHNDDYSFWYATKLLNDFNQIIRHAWIWTYVFEHTSGVEIFLVWFVLVLHVEIFCRIRAGFTFQLLWAGAFYSGMYSLSWHPICTRWWQNFLSVQANEYHDIKKFGDYWFGFLEGSSSGCSAVVHFSFPVGRLY